MNNWLVWSLLSALFAGATAVLAKIGVTGVDSNFATAIRTTVILVFTWMIASFTRSYWSFSTISFRTWLFLILSGLATGLSWLCYFRALQLGRSATRCAHGQTKCPFRNSLCGHCSSRNANVASVAWRRTCADRRGHPRLQIMNPAGCKSDKSNQFSQLEIWKPRPGSSIRIGGWTWFQNRKRLGLNHGARKGSERRSCK